MRSPGYVSGLVSWRWSPALAIGLCPVAFVVLAVAIIPDDFGGAAASRPVASKSVAVSARGPSAGEERPSDSFEGLQSGFDSNTPVAPAHNAVRGIFHSSSPVELPVDPVDPNPEPPPPPPPPPPTATIFTLPESPPPAPPENVTVEPAPTGEATPSTD